MKYTRTFEHVLRSEEQAKEKSDCSVIAYAGVTGCSYDESYKKMESLGRKKNEGMSLFAVKVLMKSDSRFRFVGTFGTPEMQYRYREFKFADTPHYGGVTLGSFLKKFPSGRYYVIVRGHVCAVVDGKIAGTGGYEKLTQRVEAAFEFNA